MPRRDPTSKMNQQEDESNEHSTNNITTSLGGVRGEGQGYRERGSVGERKGRKEDLHRVQQRVDDEVLRIPSATPPTRCDRKATCS